MGNLFNDRKKKKPRKPYDYPKDTVDADTAVFDGCSQNADPENSSLGHRIVVMGAGGVGKSALVIKFVSGEFVMEYDPTIEDAYRKSIVVDNRTSVLDILDTAGQEEFSTLQDQWMREGKAFIFVFSLTDRNSFDQVSELYEKLLRIKEADHVPTVLVGNKSDLEKDRKVQKQEGKDLAKELQCYTYVETSAKMGLNITETFYHMARAIRRTEPPDEG